MREDRQGSTRTDDEYEYTGHCEVTDNVLSCVNGYSTCSQSFSVEYLQCNTKHRP